MAWFNTSGRYLPEIMAAVNAESGGRMSSPICGNESEPSPDGEVYVCTRAPQHKAWRHIAVGAGVVAAWPRDHEPFSPTWARRPLPPRPLSLISRRKARSSLKCA